MQSWSWRVGLGVTLFGLAAGTAAPGCGTTFDPVTGSAFPVGPLPAPPLPSDPGRAYELIAEAIGRLDREEIRVALATLEGLSQPNRVTGSDNYRRASDWIAGLVRQAAPAAVVRFDQRGELRNLEIKIPGTDPAAGVFIVGGHLDSVARGPGIDDNGSGSLGAALLARALAGYTFRSEIRFVLFDGEESGLLGSAVYANALRDGGCAPGSCLKLFLNLDMIGHDPESLRRVQFFGPVQSLLDLLVESERAFQIGLTVVASGNRGCNASDDCSFANRGYNTGYVFEPVYFPLRHTPSDTVDAINHETMTRILRLVAATVATLAGVQDRR